MMKKKEDVNHRHIELIWKLSNPPAREVISADICVLVVFLK